MIFIQYNIRASDNFKQKCKTEICTNCKQIQNKKLDKKFAY